MSTCSTHSDEIKGLSTSPGPPPPPPPLPPPPPPPPPFNLLSLRRWNHRSIFIIKTASENHLMCWPPPGGHKKKKPMTICRSRIFNLWILVNYRINWYKLLKYWYFITIFTLQNEIVTYCISIKKDWLKSHEEYWICSDLCQTVHFTCMDPIGPDRLMNLLIFLWTARKVMMNFANQHPLGLTGIVKKIHLLLHWLFTLGYQKFLHGLD